MKVFVQNSNQFLEEFSKEFHFAFMGELKRHATTQIRANRIYQDVIKDRHHTHLNSTKWGSLTAYCAYLGEAGLAEVQTTEQGIFLRYIDRNPDAVRRKAKRDELERAEAKDARRSQKLLQRRVREMTRAAELNGETETEKVAFERKEGGAAIGFALQTKAEPEKKRKLENIFGNVDDDDDDDDVGDDKTEPTDTNGNKKKKRALDEIAEKIESQKAADNRKKNWIKKQLVVKIRNKELADGAYHKKKGVVLSVSDKFLAEVEMLKSGDVLRIDQQYLQTVLPKLGGAVLVVNGAHRGKRGKLDAINANDFYGSVRLDNGGGVVQRVDFDDLCKVHEPSAPSS